MNKAAFTLLAAMLFTLMAGCQSVPQPPPAAEIETSPAEAPPPAVAEQPVKPKDPAERPYRKALRAARSGNSKAALKAFRQVLAINPGYKKTFTNLGLLLLQQGEKQAAREALQKAIEQDNSDAIAYNHLAIIERNEGNFQQALVNYRKAIELDPEYANAHLNLGILLDIYIQDLPAALRHYEIFQRLTGGSDEKIEKWVIDIKRRIDSERNKQG